MKIIKFLVLLSIFTNGITLFAKNGSLNFERLSVNFKGISFNQNCVICYGDGNIILRSTNKGKSWEQIQVPLNGNNPDLFIINRIINIGNDFYGVLNKDYIIKSTDNGYTWNSTKIINNNQLFDLDFDNNNFYVLTNKSVIIFDNQLNQTKLINIDTSFHSNIIKIYSNRIILNADSGKIIYFNIIDNYKLNVFDFKLKSLCSSCIKPSQIIISDTILFTRIDKELFKTTDNGINWYKIYNDFGLCNIYKNTIYSLNSNSDYQTGLPKINYLKYNLSGMSQINKDTVSRYLLALNFTDFKYIDSLTIIATGLDKLIYISTNGGLNWILKSNLRIYKYAMTRWINDSLGYFKTYDNQMFSTSDAGTTWLPQFFQEENISSIRTPLNFYCDKEGYVIVSQNQTISGLDNFLFSKDYGKTYKSFSNSSLVGYLEDYPENFFIRKDSNLLMFFSGISLYDYYTMVFELNKDLQLVNKEMIDSISIKYVTKHELNNELIAIGYERKSPVYGSNIYDRTKYYLMYSNDFGKTWLKDVSFDLDGTLIDVSYFDNLFLFKSYTENYIGTHRYEKYFSSILYVNDKKFIKNINLDTASYFGHYFKLNDIFYYIGEKNCFSNNDLYVNPFFWQKDTIIDYKLFMPYYSNNKFAYGIIDDNSEIPIPYLYKITSNLTTCVVTKTETSGIYFYSLPPFPLPAKSLVHVVFYSDFGYGISNSDFMVYDINGTLISDNSKISVTPLSSWQYDLSYNCNGLIDGIYFIRFKKMKIDKTIPFVIAN